MVGWVYGLVMADLDRTGFLDNDVFAELMGWPTDPFVTTAIMETLSDHEAMARAWQGDTPRTCWEPMNVPYPDHVEHRCAGVAALVGAPHAQVHEWMDDIAQDLAVEPRTPSAAEPS